MKSYKFTQEDEEMLKVIKMNQDLSTSLLEQAQKLNASWDKNHEADKQFLAQFESELVNMPAEETSGSSISQTLKTEVNVPELSWEELVSMAEQQYPESIDFGDILTEEEMDRAYQRLDEINTEFRRLTKLTSKDLAFLGVAVALQCVRQYVLDPWIKKNRRPASPNDEKNHKQGNAEPGWYYVETEKILPNRVPFDATKYSSNSTISDFMKGGNHRDITLGHDPILGWVFGTANILTNTITIADLRSAHVKYVPNQGNTIHSLASTPRVFLACKERLFDSGVDGKIAVGCAIIREGIHLYSDIDTKKSLPLPFIGTVSPELASKLSKYGINTASVGTEASIAVIINFLIACVHRLFFDEATDDESLYEVRTRKILLYSNLIASTSNIIAAYLTKNPKILDVGGILVTIGRLFSDVKFITSVKDEFIRNKQQADFEGIMSEIDEMYERIM